MKSAKSMRNKTLYIRSSGVNWLRTTHRVVSYSILQNVDNALYLRVIVEYYIITLQDTVQCKTGLSPKPATRANNVQTRVV